MDNSGTETQERVMFLKRFVISALMSVCIGAILMPFTELTAFFVGCAAGCAAAAICCGVSAKRDDFQIEAVMILAIVIFCAVFFRPVLRAVSDIANSVIELWNTRFNTNVLLINGGNASIADKCVVMAGISAAVATATSRAERANVFWIVLAAVFLIFEGTLFIMAARSVPSLLICIISFGTAAELWGTYSKNNLSGAAFLCAMTAAAAVFMCTIFSGFVGSANVDRTKDRIKEGVHYMLYGDDGLPEGDMKRVRDMDDTSDSVRLKLSSPGEMTDDLYLYDFIGGDYDGYSEWMEYSSVSANEEWNGIFGWLEDNGYSAQTSCFSSLSGSYNTSGDLTVENVNADRAHLYVPFTLSEITSGRHSFNNDFNVDGKGPFGTSHYSLVYLKNVDFEGLIINYGTLEKNAAQESDTDSVYNAYVRSAYTEIDDDIKSMIDSVFFDTEYMNENSGLYSVVSRIRAIFELRSDAADGEYSGNTEFTEWFLSGGGGKRSPYLATIGTLALRAAGYPARYAEGYLVEGTQANEVTVTSKNAHAWTEVYIDNIGWIPVELTPGYYNEVVLGQQTVEISADDMPGNNESDNNYEMSEQYKELADRRGDSEDGAGVPWYAALGAVVGLLILIPILLILRRSYLKKKNREMLREAQPERYIYGRIFKILSLAGVKCDSSKPLECVDSVTETFCGVRAEEYKRMVALMQKTVFGEMPLEKNEIHSLKSFYLKLRKLLYRNSSRLKRLKLSIIDVI